MNREKPRKLETLDNEPTKAQLNKIHYQSQKRAKASIKCPLKNHELKLREDQ